MNLNSYSCYAKLLSRKKRPQFRDRLHHKHIRG
jgi:hypothetical protein